MTSTYIVKKMAKIHCARGPKRCKKCEEYAKEMRYALLEINPEDNPQATRPVISLKVEGEDVWMPFDVIAYFNKIEEVKDHVEKNGLNISQIIED